MSNQIQLTPENIQQTLGEQNQEKLILLTFFSGQNPDCVAQASILTNLAVTYTDHIIVATVDCDLQQALAGQLAQQINLQALPTLVMLKNGAPVEMLPGAQTEDDIKKALANHLPKPEMLLLDQAKQALQSDDQNSAFNFAKQAYEIDPTNSRVKLVLADICIQIQKLDDAQALLDSILEEERDAYYQNLVAKLAQALQAQESPEIQTLSKALEAEPDNNDIKVELASLFNDTGKKEQALELLFSVLRKDLNFGDAKKQYLDIVASLPDGDAIAATYRRKLYSLLY
ncbi:co-chaperone YbbN [Pseudoalteromonas citrea]|uniref:Co-chaperone YbbN n=1 Tax=Pseudoalteromonas citrea TaxID=43655 RepID=A0A5S3XP65_9GAMM|nr:MULTISPECIES: tetratricopeptide repeat protein [Pseudoalteromonas]RJE77783.1 co-chaperone YbbN [Pseudoalteromonas sp. MSK9-3]TMP40180.1 co-chaperone YbbN [Pseudoalteromonas citrea]TMP56894.1 co-chaperone YbbN [Pseudoalteromonas citrea]